MLKGTARRKNYDKGVQNMKQDEVKKYSIVATELIQVTVLSVDIRGGGTVERG